MEITASVLNSILKDALTVLSIEKNRINDLNVFPVPDGDTGLNMVLTVQGGLAHAKNYASDQSTLSEYLTALAEGMTLNSRGCSGVILALFIQGVAKKLADWSPDQKIPNTEIAQALISGYKYAYAETANPKEGTMLTMMRVFAERFSELVMDGKDALSIIKDIVPDLEETLEKTPEMLPVLKKAGVEYPVQLYKDFLSYVQSRYENQFWNALPCQVASFIKSTMEVPSVREEQMRCDK